jgi:hypothetical protein
VRFLGMEPRVTPAQEHDGIGRNRPIAESGSEILESERDAGGKPVPTFPQPALFNGSAIAALVGLLIGLVLHDPWTNHAKGPQIWLSSAAAAELAQPATDARLADIEPDRVEPQLADLDVDYVPPDPLPVTRLAPDRFDVHPAAADDAQREDADDEVADAVPPTASTDLD